MDAKIHNNHEHQSGKLSLFLNILCLIHCIVTPILFLFFPIITNYIRLTHTVEWVLIGGAALLGVFSIAHGMQHHYKTLTPLILFLTGISITILVHIFGHNYAIHQVVSIFSSLLSAYAQWLNLRYSRKTVKAAIVA